MGFLSDAIGGIFGSKDSVEPQMEMNLEGFNYLKDNTNVQQAQEQGAQASGLLAGLLGLEGGDSKAAEEAFKTFQDSTGYQFRMDEGVGAITNSRAASGILNSGATSKELMRYGQNLASAEFGNYVDMLGGFKEGGLNAAYQTGSAAEVAGQANAQVEQGRQETRSSGFGGLVSTGLGIASSIFGF